MITYLKRSFEKLKQDALSKVFYDITKWVFITALSFALSNYLPDIFAVGRYLTIPVVLSVYSALLSLMLTILITVVVVGYIFNRKYQTAKANALTDDLTGLKNHKALRTSIDEKVKNVDRTFSIIILDVDDFKKFNSQFGSNIADNLLAKLGELLNNDRRITDETFRQFLRGDEFVIVASDTNLDNAYKAAERKRTLIEQTTFSVGNELHKLTVSCGVTEYKKGKDEFTSLTDRANQALSQAKNIAGKNNTKSII